MKTLIRSYIDIGKEEQSYSEKEVKDLKTAKKEIKAGEKIHICRHDQGLPCSLI